MPELWEIRDASSLKSDKEIERLIDLYLNDLRPGETYEDSILSFGPSAYPVVFVRDLKAMVSDCETGPVFFRAPHEFERRQYGHLMLRMTDAWPSDVVVFLCKALKSNNSHVRFASAAYLGVVKHPFVEEAIPLLQAATKDPNWDVRTIA